MRFHKIEKGRYVVYLGKDYGDSQIRFEFSHKYNFGLGFKIGREENDLQFSAYCWKLFSVYVTIESRKFKYVDDLTVVGFTWQTAEHVIRAQIMDYSEMDSSKPAILSTYWNYRDWLFGRSIHSESSHGQSYHIKHGVLALPEGNYDLDFDFYTSYWHRPRSPFTRSIDRVEVTPKVPIPIPGKGENSYDLDEDATYSITMPANGRSISEIIQDIYKDTMERRERYGGKNWLPESARKVAQ